ncbi:unnamed protein product [marine sediment metagenome]|uniref:Metal-binding protein n=2 Tax=marine sediment metagenome TaxID=412755 RepID=X1U1R8_9ZZZZ
MGEKIECAKCSKVVCGSKEFDQGPSNCPTKTKRDIIQQALAEYDKPEIREFARQASIQEFECYMNLPEGRTARNPRVEEVVQFAKKMGYKKLGIAFCAGLRNEAKILTRILENRGFDVVSVCCKAGGIPKETIGITEEQKIAGPGQWETMCSPITQAEILNSEGTEFNIVVGLCVGHDSLFIKYAQAPVTVLIVKDRVFGHNPAAGLYLSGSYYRKLMRREPVDSTRWRREFAQS